MPEEYNVANTCESCSTERLQKSRFRTEMGICNERMNWKGLVFKYVLSGCLFPRLLSSEQLFFLKWQSHELFAPGLDSTN